MRLFLFLRRFEFPFCGDASAVDLQETLEEAKKKHAAKLADALDEHRALAGRLEVETAAALANLKVKPPMLRASAWF